MSPAGSINKIYFQIKQTVKIFTQTFITSKGIVYPCLFVPHQMGDIHEQSLLDILNSHENRELQKRVFSGDCPNCWVECEIYRVLNENMFQVIVFGIRETIKNWIIRN